MTSGSRIKYELLEAPIDGAIVDALLELVVRVFESAQRDYLVWPIEHMPNLSIQLAREGAELVGFKIGYAEAATRYYSWLGGVRQDHRRQGIGAELMARQHARARAAGYSCIRTGAVDDNVAMLTLNLTAGFRVIGNYTRGGSLRVMLLKELCALPDADASKG